jgi:hypothetical protein
MPFNLKTLKTWEINFLELFNLGKESQLFFYFNFLKSKTFKDLEGDVVESGVFRGKSLLTSALILNSFNKGNTKKIWGYDTFSGFPKLSNLDKIENFSKLYKQKRISKSHYQNVLKLQKYHKAFKSSNMSAKNISTSNNFDNTSYSLITKKIKFFKLSKKINLIKGDFKFSMRNKNNLPKKISAGLIDCDLSEGYESSLKYFWPKLSLNGRLFLDEYYSLKFPGPRYIVDEFLLKNKNAKLIKEGTSSSFERWSLKKIKL